LSGVDNCEVDLDGGYAIPYTATRTFNSKYYFYPVPSNQISTSDGATTQNPGW